MERHSHCSQAQTEPASSSERRRFALSIPTSLEKGLVRAFISLRHRNFRLFWSGQVISLIGYWMQSIGQAWLVLEMTDSAWQLGLVGALQFVPVLLFSIFGGVLADRWPKRRILLVTQSMAMIQVLLLWVMITMGTIQLWHLYVMALLLGLTNSLDMPTRRAFIFEIVGREDLPNAIALNSSLATLARIIGPGLGGIIIAGSSVTMLFLLNALSYLPALLGLALIRSRELHVQELQPTSSLTWKDTWKSLREGVDYVRQSPAVLLMIVVVGLVLLFGSNFNVVLPLFATDVLHIDAAGFGFLSAALGVGSLLAALWLAWSNRQPTVRHVLIGMLVFGLLEIVFAISPVYLLSLVLIAGVGFMETTFAAQSITTLQTIIPDHLRGRVMSVHVLFFDGTVPPGYLLIGWLSSLYGPSTAMFIGAILSLLVLGLGWMWWRSVKK